MLGSLMMLVSGSSVRRPSSARLSGTRCASVRKSGNSPRMRAATEMSLVVTLIPAGAAKVRTIGKKELVASSGASSVRVYMMVGCWVLITCFPDRDENNAAGWITVTAGITVPWFWQRRNDIASGGEMLAWGQEVER